MTQAHVETRTVVFTDLVSSTELRVQLGEAAADELRRIHDALLTEAITGSGGTVVKGLGDGLLATFESAADAVTAVVAIQQTVDMHSRSSPERAFAVRVGASVGDVSTEAGDVFGVPVVEASRLCAMASGGEILVADLVRALARGRGDVIFESMGDLDVKGLPDPVPACRVAWLPLVDASAEIDEHAVPMPAALLGAATAYVGREPLRAALVEAWRDARTGVCRTILLSGEPGVGKTRTTAELARIAHADGALVLFGRCDEDLAVPYQPFVEALDYYTREATHSELGRLGGELQRLVPDLAHRITGLVAPVHSDPASEEYRLFEAVASWLVEMARTATGLVLVLDDIHWATKPTLQLFQHAVRVACDEHAPILVLATYRDTDIDRTHPLSASLSDLRRLPGVDRITVDNLSSDEVTSFIIAAAGHDLDEPILRLASAIYAETEGNPFFVGEVLRHLIETGGVRREGDRWVVGNPDHVSVPEGVRDVIGRRLNRLPQAANDVLSVAAVLGRDFDVQVLMSVVDATENDALDALDLAMRARLVEETGTDQYHFAHALVRATLYDELSATRRRRLHRRVADALEKLHPEDVRALAYHCIEGGSDASDMGRALRYSTAAAEQSLAARAFADAAAGFRSALDLLEDSDSDDARRAAILCGLGEAQRDQGESVFRETLLKASALADASGDVDLQVRAVLANTRGFASIIGDIDRERLEQIERVLARVPSEPSPTRARLMGLHASEMTFSGDHARRAALADEAEAMARSLGDDRLLGEVLVATAYARIDGTRWRYLLDRAEEATRLVDASGDPTMRVVVRVYLTGAQFSCGLMDEATQSTLDMVAIAEAEAPPIVEWTARFIAGRDTLLAGRIDEAEANNNALLEWGNRLDQPDGAQWWASVLVAILWLRGHPGLSADAAAQFAVQYPTAGTWKCAHVWLLADAGRLDEARAALAGYNLDPAAVAQDPWPLAGVFQLSMAAWFLDDAALGERVAAVLEPHADSWSHYYLASLGPVTWALGLSTAAAQRYDESVDYLDRAVKDLERKGHTAYLPSAQLHLGEVLLRRGGAGDAERARQVLATARDGAVTIGAPGVVARIDAVAP